MEDLGPSPDSPASQPQSPPHPVRDWGAAGLAATLVGAVALGWVWFAYTEAYAAVSVRPEEVGVEPLRLLSVTVTILLPLAVIFAVPVVVTWTLLRERPALAFVAAGVAWLVLWRLFVWAPSAVFYVLVLIGLVAVVLPLLPLPSWVGPRLTKVTRRLTIVVSVFVIGFAGLATANARDAIRDLTHPEKERSFAGMVLAMRPPAVCIAGTMSRPPGSKPMLLLGTATDVHVLLDGDRVWRVPTGVSVLQPVEHGRCVG